VGGVLQLIVGHPLDTMKVNMQTNHELKGLGDVFKHILTKDGPKGFYKGVASPLFGFTAFNAILFASYGVGNRIARGSLPESQLLPYHRVAFAAAFAGVCATLIESPMDLFKAKVQSQRPDINGKLQYKGTFDCVAQVARQNGIRGVYQGFPATLLRNLPANACYFVGYEWMKRTVSANLPLSSLGRVFKLIYLLLVDT
jgi:solute carrier family 25 (mitochondrial carnitine/acylcarnitine transporter), member 20/29